jgi:hypothetical protein
MVNSEEYYSSDGSCIPINWSTDDEVLSGTTSSENEFNTPFTRGMSGDDTDTPTEWTSETELSVPFSRELLESDEDSIPNEIITDSPIDSPSISKTNLNDIDFSNSVNLDSPSLNKNTTQSVPSMKLQNIMYQVDVLCEGNSTLYLQKRKISNRLLSVTIDYIHKVNAEEKITILNLADNDISKIPCLKKFKNLSVLYLNLNRLHYFDFSILPESCAKLYLRDNSIDDDGFNFGDFDCSNIVYLDISNNDFLSKVDFKGFTNLRTLNISENNFQEICDILPTKIEKLKCKRNKVRDFNDANFPNLCSLNLTKNILCTIVLQNTYDLVNLSENKLCLKDVIEITEPIGELLLHNNLLTKIPKIFPKEIGILSLNNNSFKYVYNLPEKLSVLHMKNNKIESINLRDVSGLTYINLNNNKLKQLPYLHDQDDDSVILKLNGNHIVNINLTYSDDLLKIKRLHLRGSNPYVPKSLEELFELINYKYLEDSSDEDNNLFWNRKTYYNNYFPTFISRYEDDETDINYIPTTGEIIL